MINLNIFKLNITNDYKDKYQKRKDNQKRLIDTNNIDYIII